MASANQYDRPHRSSGIPREQRERERAERHAQRASAQAAAAAAGTPQPGVTPPSPALLNESRGKGGRQSELASASNVAIINGRPAGQSQPQPKRQSSGQVPQVGTPGIYPYAPASAGYGGSDRYAAGNETYDSRNGTNQSLGPGGQQQQQTQQPSQSAQNAMASLSASGLNNTSVDHRSQGNNNIHNNGQHMTNGEYMDHEEEETKKSGFAKFIDFLTCRCG